MAKIKIVSDPYNREISYFSYNDFINNWEPIKNNNPNSKLREDETGKTFLPFKIKEIIDIIIEEYYARTDKVEIMFEGTQDEYVCRLTLQYLLLLLDDKSYECRVSCILHYTLCSMQRQIAL